MISIQRIWRGLSRHGWGLSAEAALELVLARLATMLPARYFLPCLHVASERTLPDVGQVSAARRVGVVVAAVAQSLPFRALCLQQAIAARRMLRRRGYSAALYLGVNTTRAARIAPKLGTAAHAWLCLGTEVICGDVGLDQYAVVARFG